MDAAPGDPLFAEEAVAGVGVDADVDFGIRGASDVVGQGGLVGEGRAGSGLYDAVFLVYSGWHWEAPYMRGCYSYKVPIFAQDITIAIFYNVKIIQFGMQ